MEKTIEEIEVDVSEDIQKKLILFNDDVNTFDFIIICLIEVCKYKAIQAENCTMIAHYKGKCCIKKGTFKELEPFHTKLGRRNITTEIQ